MCVFYSTGLNRDTVKQARLDGCLKSAILYAVQEDISQYFLDIGPDQIIYSPEGLDRVFFDERIFALHGLSWEEALIFRALYHTFFEIEAKEKGFVCDDTKALEQLNVTPSVYRAWKEA